MQRRQHGDRSPRRASLPRWLVVAWMCVPVAAYLVGVYGDKARKALALVGAAP